MFTMYVYVHIWKTFVHDMNCIIRKKLIIRLTDVHIYWMFNRIKLTLHTNNAIQHKILPKVREYTNTYQKFTKTKFTYCTPFFNDKLIKLHNSSNLLHTLNTSSQCVTPQNEKKNTSFVFRILSKTYLHTSDINHWQVFGCDDIVHLC